MGESNHQVTQCDDFDVVFIGGGISTASTLTDLITTVGQAQRPPGFQLNVAVVDDHGELGGGLAYGARGGPSSLIITNLQDFCPEPTRSRFVAWLGSNRDAAFEAFFECKGQLSQEWIEQSEAAFLDEDYDQLYLPRSVFGAFMKAMLLEEAEAADWLTLEHIVGSAVGVCSSSELTVGVIEQSTGDTIHLSARNVVLGIGTPPQRPIFGDIAIGDCRFVDKVYEPTITEQLDQLRQALSRAPQANVLLVGSNATALDVLFNIIDDIELNAMIEQITVLSPQGSFPHRLTAKSVDFSAAALESLINQDEPISAYEIGRAVIADQNRATDSGRNIAEILPAINSRVMEALRRCDSEQTRIFAETIGVEIGRIQRRAGGVYFDTSEQLQRSGRLTHIRGRFDAVEEADSGMLRVLGKNDHGLSVELEHEVAAVINCTGFELLGAETSSPLVRSLLDNGIVTINGSHRGFTVADDFSASPGVYVNGPCLAGNVIEGKPVWHMEHCGRILDVASRLSPILAERVLQDPR